MVKEKERIPEFICLFFAPPPDRHVDAICWRYRRLRGIFGLNKDDDNEAADEILTGLSNALEDMEGETDLLLGGGIRIGQGECWIVRLGAYMFAHLIHPDFDVSGEYLRWLKQIAMEQPRY